MKTRFALVCASSFLAFGLPGCGSDSSDDGTGGNNASGAGGEDSGADGGNIGGAGGGDSGAGGGDLGGAGGGDSGAGGGDVGGAGGGANDISALCEQSCTKKAATDCPKKQEKNVCIARCISIQEALYANTDCDSFIEAYDVCASKQSYECDSDGNPSVPKDACKTEQSAFTSCYNKYMEDPKCDEACDKIIAAHCTGESGDKDMCVAVCRANVLPAICSKECWPKWQSFLDCSAKTVHTCNAENKAVAAECEPLGQEFKDCMYPK